MLGAKQKHIASLHEDKGLTHLEIECTASLCQGGNPDRRAAELEWKWEYVERKCLLHRAG